MIAEPGISAYITAKHGVIGLSKAAAVEYASQGIRINALAPGLVTTAMTKEWFDDPNMRAHFTANTPIGRVSQPEEMAGMVLLRRGSCMMQARMSVYCCWLILQSSKAMLRRCITSCQAR